jgi:hypothetical protein
MPSSGLTLHALPTHGVLVGSSRLLGPSIITARLVSAATAAARRLATGLDALNRSCPPSTITPVALRRAVTSG